MTGKTSLSTYFMIFLLLVVGLALTPTIQSSINDAKYINFTEYKDLDPATDNTTTTTYTGRMLSGTPGGDNTTIWICTLNATDSGGDTTLYIDATYTYDTATNTVEFTTLNGTADYRATLTYQYLAMASVNQTLLDLVPLLYVVTLLSVAVVAVWISRE